VRNVEESCSIVADMCIRKVDLWAVLKRIKCQWHHVDRAPDSSRLLDHRSRKHALRISSSLSSWSRRPQCRSSMAMGYSWRHRLTGMVVVPRRNWSTQRTMGGLDHVSIHDPASDRMKVQLDIEGCHERELHSCSELAYVSEYWLTTPDNEFDRT